ncbi:MAG TPA: hypothetical protein VNN10_02805 [Dehalococcoidia bacterium]|nr:hypothetical protein [Dehalococcoidia bacterium]
MSEPGPFDRILESSAARDRTARGVLLAMGALGLLLLGFVLFGGSLFGDGNQPAAPTAPGSTNARLPKVPEGYEALSRLRTLEASQEQGPVELTVSLEEPVSDGRNIGLYTYRGGKWQRIASATLVNNGAAAKGQVSEVPSNVAVLRRTASSVNVSGWVLPGQQVDPAALEVLTAINPVDYYPLADGTVAGTASVLSAPGKAILPTVRATAPREIEAVNTILASPQLRDAHISALLQIALQPGYAGIDLDYPSVAPARKPDFTAFINVLADRLHASNRLLTITLPPPVKAGINWDTGAFDWKEIGRVADQVKLAPELDPSIYYRRMEEIVAFLKPNVDLRKVSLVVGRASREKAPNGLRLISLREALSIASALEVRTAALAPGSSVVIVGKNIFQDDGATGIRWDEQAFAVSFSYPGVGGQRTVWFENSLSVAFKLDFARRSGLGGVHLDDVALDPASASLWEPFVSYVEDGTVKLSQPNGVLLRPLWQSQAGTIEPGQKGNVVWKAPPQAGVYDVSLIVSDGVVRAIQKVVLDVRAPAAGPTPAAGTPRPGGASTPASPTPTRTAAPAASPTPPR